MRSLALAALVSSLAPLVLSAQAPGHWRSYPMSMPDGSYVIRYTVTPVSDREYTYAWQWSKNTGAWHPGGGRGRKN